LTNDELRRWRDGLRKSMAPASVNRVCNAFRAALNLAADNARGSISRAAWEIGLKAIPGSTETRNVVLPGNHIRRLITEAPKESDEFGLLIEAAAITGARPSQLARLSKRGSTRRCSFRKLNANDVAWLRENDPQTLAEKAKQLGEELSLLASAVGPEPEG